MYSSRNSRLDSLTKVYIIAVDTWNSYFNMHVFAFQTLLWNNTSPMWSMDSLTAFEDRSRFIEENILPNYTEALSYDLGNYTAKYRDDLVVKKACGYALLADKAYLCPDIYGGILNTNYLAFLKEKVVRLRNIIEEWKFVRHDWLQVHKILESKVIQGIWAMYDTIGTDMYYYMVLEVTDTIISEITSNLDFADRIREIEELLIISWFLLLSVILFLGLNIRLTAMQKAINVTPWNLWKENFKLNKYLFG